MSKQGNWDRRRYEVPDGRLVQAEREIYNTFGDKVSISAKGKSILKFGRNPDLTANVKETIWGIGGNETYVSSNIIDTISSSSALDLTAMIIEGHTVEGTGFDQKFTFVSQEITLVGQGKATLTTPLARTSRIYNNNGSELVGNIYVYEDTAITNGVPNDLTKVHITIEDGFQQSFKAATTFSNEDYAILTGGFGSVSVKQAASVDFFLEVAAPGRVFREGAAVSATSTGGAWNVNLDPCVIVPTNYDVRVTAISSTSGVEVFSNFSAYLAKVIT